MSAQASLFGDMQLPTVINDDWPADYEAQFWGAYPPARRVDKKDAMKALARVRKNGVPWSIVIHGTMLYNRETRDTDPRYIKHPTTFLNKGSYENGEQPREARSDPGAGGQQGRPAGDPIMAGMARVARRRLAGRSPDSARGDDPDA